MSYLEQAKDDAKEMANYFIDEIAEQFIEDGKVSDDIDDSYHHETHIDKSYDLQESAEILDDLSNYEEEDEGLWEGQKPKEAIATQAAYTYGNAVIDCYQKLIENINDDTELCNLYDELYEIEDVVDAEIEEQKEEHDAEEEKSKEEHDLNEFEREKFPENRIPYTLKQFEPLFDREDETNRRKEEKEKEIEEMIEKIIGEF